MARRTTFQKSGKEVIKTRYHVEYMEMGKWHKIMVGQVPEVFTLSNAQARMEQINHGKPPRAARITPISP
jgi:hypothetical protein